MTPRERITERVCRHGDVNDLATPRPLLTLEEFFADNEDVGSIGCNLTPMPGPAAFHKALARLAARPEVADVRVQITMFDAGDGPFSDTIWIITTATPEQVRAWFDEAIRPDECWAGWLDGTTYEPCPVPPGMRPIGCLWD